MLKELLIVIHILEWIMVQIYFYSTIWFRTYQRTYGSLYITRKVWLHSSQGYPPDRWLDNFSMLKVVFYISSDMTGLVQPIPPMHSQENAKKLQIWLVSLSQNTVKMWKINRPWPKCKQLIMQSGYICMSNFKPFLPCILKKIARNPKFGFTKSKWCQNEENQQIMAKI